MKYLITAIVIFTTITSFAISPLDSLSIESDKGKLYIVHKVDKEETLYRLLKRYGCSPAEVLSANPSLEGSSTIYENQVLRIPYKAANEEGAQRSVKKAATSSKKLYHVVAEGETLYAISRLYDIPVEQIQKANQLTDNTITLNQKLILSPDYTPNAPAGDDPKSVAKVQPKNPSDYVPNAPTGNKITETGIAALINVGGGSNKHVALHRFAPVGTQIKVRNDATGDVVWVKVIGKLPDTGDNLNVIIKMSPVAFNKLNPRDSRIRAVVSYDMPIN